jgi:hypothetical protein
MIPLQYLWQSHSGAAHRKNVDTPSLGGCRFSRKRITVVIRLRINDLAEV